MTTEVGIGGDQVRGLRTCGDDEVLVAQQRQQAQLRPSTGLRRTQHVALATLFDVETGEFEPVRRRGDRIEPLTGRRRLGKVRDQQAQTWMPATADPAAQLVQL